jgi:hypothetical protein
MSRVPLRRWGLLLVGAMLLAALGLGASRLMSRTTLGEIRREGPAAVVRPDPGAPQLWVMGKRTEEGPGVRRGLRMRRLYHLELRGHDTTTGERLWQRRLRTLDDDEGGHGAQARILGPDGDRVWLFVHDQPVAVAASDGAVRATTIEILAANPSLQGLLPARLDDYTFDDGLVFVAADGRRLRIASGGLLATAYEPRSEQDFDQRRFMSTRWHGGYDMRRFLTPQSRTPARWVGLYTDAEAREAGNDGFGDHLKDPDRTWRDDRLARRSLWTASFGRTRQFSEGSHERLLALRRLNASAEYLQGGFLRNAGQATPLLLDGEGLLLVHLTRIDADGRARLDRVDVGADLQPRTRWSAGLPFTQLHSRWQWPDRLLMIGQLQVPDDDGRARQAERAAVVGLRDGSVRGWDLTWDRPLPVEAGGHGASR